MKTYVKSLIVEGALNEFARAGWPNEAEKKEAFNDLMTAVGIGTSELDTGLKRELWAGFLEQERAEREKTVQGPLLDEVVIGIPAIVQEQLDILERLGREQGKK